MEYLGCFLSTTNNITEDEDKVVKYFYYRPDRYDTPSADLETIFNLRSVEGFPKVNDVLAENSNYIVTNVDIAKRLDDTEKGVKNVSYVVTCTYDTIENVNKRKGASGPDEVYINGAKDKDKNGNKVTANTAPWLIRNTFTSTPISVEVPMLSGIDYSIFPSYRNVPVINTAGKRILASTTRYRREFTIKYNSHYRDTDLDSISANCYVNLSAWTPVTEGFLTFPARTVLIQPPTYEVKYWNSPSAALSSDYESYYSYSIKLIFDPQGWDKKLLNIGTFARFQQNQPAEQIYSYRTISGAVPGPLNYTNLAGVVQAGGGGSTLSGISWEKVTEPLPLTISGFIDMNAINDPENNPYYTLTFHEYPRKDFSLLRNI